MQRSAARIYDEYLAASARAGDRSAFARLAERWQGRLLAHAYRLSGDREVARDIAQDAWADIARGLPGLRDAAVFPAWAYRIVTRRAADAIRRAQLRRRTDNAIAAEPPPADYSAAQLENGADATPLNKAMRALPADQRAAVALFYGEDFTVSEIAAALSVPAGTVKTRLMRARRKLREVLEGGASDE